MRGRMGKAEHRSLAGGQPVPPYLCLVFTKICLTVPGAWAPPLTFWTSCADGRLGSPVRRSPPTDTCGSVILCTLMAASFPHPGAFLGTSQPLKPHASGVWDGSFSLGNPTRPERYPLVALQRGPWIDFSGPPLGQVQKLPCLHQDLSPHTEPGGWSGLEHGPHSSPTWLSFPLGLEPQCV